MLCKYWAKRAGTCARSAVQQYIYLGFHHAARAGGRAGGGEEQADARHAKADEYGKT